MSIVQEKFKEQGPAFVDTHKRLVECQNVGVKYEVGIKREDIQSRIFDTLLRRRSKEPFWALRDVSFVGYAGDILGVIGSNGAGKTTLCKVISGLLRPDTGDIKVGGSVSALLSLGTGFNNQLSGRENIFLNGMMLGFSSRYIRDLFNEMVEFSGLGRFIEEPIKNYSSGMKARLGFSIAAMIEPEVLIIDEALSTGDLKFSEKAGEKLKHIIGASKTAIVVTHQMGFVEEHCTRALWIDNGTIGAAGPPNEVVGLYGEHTERTSKKTRIVHLCETQPSPGGYGVVKARNVGVKFSLMGNKNGDAGGSSKGKKIWGKTKGDFWALKDVNFTVNEGDVVGVIGANGAGKTTLCRVLSGILKPDQGDVSVDGDITALLSFGAGFNYQLTGRDNVYLNGLMLGIPKRKLKNVYGDIVEFSEIEKFMDQPVKNYSSGMRARLGFSIAAMLRPDVFIIDEALSVGDISFYEKASAKIQELMECAKAVIVVTHNMDFVETVCTRALWLDDGTIKYDGSPEKAVGTYRESVKISNK